MIAADKRRADVPIGSILAQHVLPLLTVDAVELQYRAVQEQDEVVTATALQISRLSKELDQQRVRINTLQDQQQVERTGLASNSFRSD